MITVRANDKTVEIPSSWEELTSRQYVDTVDLLRQLMHKEIPLADFRLRLLGKLIDYHPSRKFNKYREQINENLYRLSELMHWPLKPVYEDPEMLSVLSPELKDLLEVKFPYDITDPKWEKEIRMIRGHVKYSASVNFSMKRNPMPWFDYHGQRFCGPAFNIDSLGIVETDIRAMEYIDAMEYYQLFQKTRMGRYLDRLVTTLYRPDRSVYVTFDCQMRAGMIEVMDGAIKHAVLYFFQNIQEFLAGHPVYKYLFQKTEPQTGKISLGMVTTVYNLSKEGYGTKQQVSDMGLEDYLNMLLKTLMDSVRQMKRMKHKDHEITNELNIPSELIYKV
jgi:hypothetical protein